MAEEQGQAAREGGSLMADAVLGDRVEVAPDLYVEKHPVDALREQDVNAHVVPPKVFERLVENITERGALESMPYCCQIGDGPIEIVSGHHRVRAARAAGLKEIWVLVDRSNMTRSRIVAKQLAHNFLVGYDDSDVVKQLIKNMEHPDDLLHSGAPEELIGGLDPEAVDLFLPHADFDWRHVGFAVLPHQFEMIEELCKRLEGPHDLVVTMMPDQFEQFVKAAASYARLRDIRSGGTVVSVLTELALAELGAEPAGDPPTDGERWVPLASVLGTVAIPEDAATVVVDAIEKAKKNGDVGEKNAWQVIEQWAADYMAGQ